jgi:hypothetical protein
VRQEVDEVVVGGLVDAIEDIGEVLDGGVTPTRVHETTRE